MRHDHPHHHGDPSDGDQHDQRRPDPTDPLTGRAWRPWRHRPDFPGQPYDAADAEPRRRGRGGPGGGPGCGGHDAPLPHEHPFGAGHEPGFGPERRLGPGFERGFGPGFGPGPGHGFGPRGRGRGPGRRAGRGDIRAAVLLLLVEQPMHGYQLIQEIAERSGGQWRPSPGAIYPALALLEDEGLVTITADSGRKLASLTDAGRAHVEEHTAELGNPWQDAQDRPVHPGRALREAIEGLGAAAGQVARTGDEAQNTRALAIIDRARRELYLILAGEPAPDDAPGAAGPTSEPGAPAS